MPCYLRQLGINSPVGIPLNQALDLSAGTCTCINSCLAYNLSQLIHVPILLECYFSDMLLSMVLM